MGNLDIYNHFKVVPIEAQKPIGAGRLKGMTDINPMWRIKALTELFGPCGIGWYYEVKSKWMETSGTETAAFVDIELFIKSEGGWSKPIYGTGGSKFIAKESKGPYMDDECYKKATTDAIGVACKQLGIGADVYWSKDATKYDTAPEAKEKAKQTQYKPELITYCSSKRINLEKILVFNGTTEQDLSEEQAKQLLFSLKEKYGD